MEYNKLHFHKINDHKVLHKVKKHWVVVSMALLSAMGTTGLLHSQDVQASTNHAQLTGNQQSAVNHSSSLAKVNQDQLHQRIVNSVQKLSPQRPQSIHTQINQLGRNAVQHGLNKQQSQNVSSNQEANSASRSANVQQPTVGRTMSAPTVNHQQIMNAVKKNQQKQQRTANAKANLNQLDQRITETAPLHETGTEAGPKPADVTSTVNSQLNDIDNQYASINDYYNDVNTANNSMQTSYNAAHLDVSRYYNSCTTTYDGSHMTSDNGGGSASEQLDSINSDLTSVARVLKPEVSASINASYISSVADNISMSVQTNGSAQNYATQVSSLDSEIDSMCTTMSSGHSTISNLAGDVSTRTSLANSYVASVSSQAATDASNVVKNNNLNAPIVNVSTNKEMECAMKDGYIHQINIVKNMNLWDTTSGAGINGVNGNDVNVPPRDLTIDGLNEQGKWNVYDGAGTEWDLGNGADSSHLGSDPRTHLIVKNIHTYGTNYYGPWSFWGSERPSQITYDNFSYDGAQLNDSTGGTQNVNEDFAGKININVAGAYSPSGKYQNYSYHTGGLSPVPYADEKNDKSTTVPDLAVCHSNGHGADNSDYAKLGVNLSNDQQVIESYGNVTIDSNCNFKGYTLDGNAVQMDGDGTFKVDHDAKVLLVPRGTWGENNLHAQNNTSGIYLGGQTSAIDVGTGATLDIYPSVATNNQIDSGAGDYDCAPYAIFDRVNGNIDIANGGTININYPDIDKYTPKQFGSGSSGNGGYSLPKNGVIYISGGSITAEPYSSLIVNGGNPGTAWNTSDPDSGNLVRFDTKVANSVNADAHSTVRLVVGGTEPMTMFRAPSGDSIQVTDPKEFSLDGSNNTHAQGATQSFQDYQKQNKLDKDFNIASSGVGIEGDQVIAHDAITGKSFGQFARFALPGGSGAFGTGPTTQADGSLSVIGDLEKGLGGNPGSTGATLANFLPYALNPTFNQAGVDSIDHTINVSYLLGMNGVNAQTQDQTLHMSGLLDNGQIPKPQSMIYYNTKTLPISDGGFNFSQGFTFLGVPSTYVEGLNVQTVMKKGTTNQPLYKVVSGYANPGSYIKLRTLKNSIDNYNSTDLSASPMSAQLSQPIIINQTYFDNHKDEFGRFSGASQLPNVFDKQAGDSGNAAEDENGLNDHDNDYAPGDAHNNGYIAVADNHTGAWSYKLPVNFDTDNLVVSDRNQTLEYPKAARLVKSYVKGMDNVTYGWTNKGIPLSAQGRPADTSTNADEYDADYNNFPKDTYPKIQSDGQVDNRPTGLEHDPTGTDDDEANQVQENDAGDDDVSIDYVPLSIPSERGYREDDDTNAGQYFKAGYFKGLHDLLSMQKDNAISSMPEPFLIGYEAAQLASMNPNSSADIQNIIDDVEQVKHDLEWTQHRHPANTDPDNNQGQHYYPDYLPRVNSDNASTASDVAKLSSTVSNLDTLANEVDVSSGTHTTLGSLNSVSSLLSGSMSNANQNSSSILTDQSQVSSIDSDINQMLSSLYAAQKVVTSGMANYNAESRAAVRASNAGNTNLTTLDNTIALTNVSSVNDAVSNAYPASDIAHSEDSSASSFANSADDNYSGFNSTSNSSTASGSSSQVTVFSNGVSQDNITIRSSASNAEASAFTSLANSYNAWGSINDSFVNAESQLAHRRFVQISNYQGQYTSAINALNAFAASLTPTSIGSLSGAQSLASRASSSVSSEKAALKAASTSNQNAYSNAQQYDDSASSAFSEIASQITSLSNDTTKASNNNVDQKNQNDHGNFDMAGMLNGTTFSAIASAGGASAAQTIESTAVSEVSTAESAWDQIDNIFHRVKPSNTKVGRSLMRMVRTLHYIGGPLTTSLPSNLGRGLVRGSVPQRYGRINVAYRDVNTGRILDTISLIGREGKVFDLGRYENNLPSGNHSFVGVQQGSDVTQFVDHNGQPQKVVINVASAYGMVRVHFVQADSINAANRQQPSAWQRVPNSIDEQLTGKIGDTFSPEYYEYNTPEHTEFAYLAGGSEIDSYQPDPQDLYIAVNSTDHRF